MASITEILTSLIDSIGFTALDSGKIYEITLVTMTVTLLGVVLYSYDIDPSWIALVVIGGGSAILSFISFLPMYISPILFTLGVIILVLKRFLS